MDETVILKWTLKKWDQICVAQDSYQWQASLNKIINF
jgi:hypothetical protein